MLYTVVKKMKYDECYNFEQEVRHRFLLGLLSKNEVSVHRVYRNILCKGMWACLKMEIQTTHWGCGIQMMEDKILKRKRKRKKVLGLCGLNNNFGLFLELKCS